MSTPENQAKAAVAAVEAKVNPVIAFVQAHYPKAVFSVLGALIGKFIL
jgi:hypothetical protein